MKPYIIAEIGCNTASDMGLTYHLINEAKNAGCSAVKFQAFDTDHIIKDMDADRVKLLTDCQIDDWKLIAETANELSIDWYVSVFHKDAWKAVKKYKPCRWKSAAPDLVEASKWRIKGELWASYDPRYYLIDPKYNHDVISKADVAFLCRSDYPALPSAYFTKIMQQCMDAQIDGKDVFQGLSDHTVGLELVEAIGKDFTYFEKHFKMDNDCVDNFALNPEQMRQYVELINSKQGDNTMETERLQSYQRRFE